MARLKEFVQESNRIESIFREPTDAELLAHNTFIMHEELTVAILQRFVDTVQPGALLRSQPGLNVRVGNHTAPTGGPKILSDLEKLLTQTRDGDPYTIHRQYEILHPFTDGNGRSGRALWLWMMDRQRKSAHALKLGFLHTWYYQSLANQQSPSDVKGDAGKSKGKTP